MRASEIINEDWNKVNHQDKTDGLSRKAVKAYRRENPGSKLQTAVTTKPSKLKPGSKAAKRRKSFCARMSGNKGPMKKPNGKPTPKALALRRWNCESIEEMRELIQLGESYIAEIKKGQKDSNGFTKCWPGKHAEGTKKGKNGKPVRNCVPNESVNEMDKSGPQPGRDGHISHSTYGSRDKHDVGNGPDIHLGPKSMMTSKQIQDRALDALKKTLSKPENMAVLKRMKNKEEGMAEEWSQKYKNSINCSNPKGFSQKAHCAGKKKK